MRAPRSEDALADVAEQPAWLEGLTVRMFRPGDEHVFLLHAFHEFPARGFSEVGLGVDAASLTGATRLYESVGTRVTAEFDFYEKQLA
ncbi:MAG TPA: hypothetical protein VGQ15_02695 [Gaiellaceae bacterium]|jgi:hypothetical protein|nr:hypothetical protein [Gaiellaceae bacterium]